MDFGVIFYSPSNSNPMLANICLAEDIMGAFFSCIIDIKCGGGLNEELIPPLEKFFIIKNIDPKFYMDIRVGQKFRVVSLYIGNLHF